MICIRGTSDHYPTYLDSIIIYSQLLKSKDQAFPFQCKFYQINSFSAFSREKALRQLIPLQSEHMGEQSVKTMLSACASGAFAIRLAFAADNLKKAIWSWLLFHLNGSHYSL